MATGADHLLIQCTRAREALEMRVRQGVARGGAARHMVQDLLQFDMPIAARYKNLDVIRILQDNCSLDTGPGLEALMHGLSILERYGKNLLRSDRPNQWRVVRLSNNIFKMEVDIIKGARDILRLLGYSKLMEDGLSYPDEYVIPDVPMVASVTADIILLRQELLMLMRSEHRQERDFFSYIPLQEVRQLQMLYQQQQQQATSNKPETLQRLTSPPIKDFTYLRGGHPLQLPPTYEDISKSAEKNLSSNIEGTELHSQSHHEGVIQTGGTGIFAPQPVDHQDERILDDELCDICGVKRSNMQCGKCSKNFCVACDKIFHQNPKRRDHTRVPWQFSKSNRTYAKSNYPAGDINNEKLRIGSASYSPIQMETCLGPGAAKRTTSQPTVSGARLLPTTSGRMLSAQENDSEWTRKVNRMATDLMDLGSPEAQSQMLLTVLKDLDKEAEKYKGGIHTLLSKGDEKPSLVSHFQEKLEQIEGVKKQLKTLCGQEECLLQDPHELCTTGAEINSGNWSFNSVPSRIGLKIAYRHPTSPVDKAHLKTTEHNFNIPGQQSFGKEPVHQPAQQIQQLTSESSEVPVASLIDLSANPLDASISQEGDVHMEMGPGGSDKCNQICASGRATSEETRDDETLVKAHLAGGDNLTSQNRGGTPAGVELFALDEPKLERSDNAEQPAKLIPGNVRDHLGRENSLASNMILGQQLDEQHSHMVASKTAHSPGDLVVSGRLEETTMSTTTNLFHMISSEKLQEHIKKEENHLETTQFLDWIRAGDSSHYRPELVCFSVNELEDEDNLARYTPTAWLERKWLPRVESFIAYAREKGLRILHADAEKVLIDGNDDFDYSLELLFEEKNEQVKCLSDEFGYLNAKKAMAQSRGDHYHATSLLQKRDLTEMLQEFEETEGGDGSDVLHIKKMLTIEDPERKIHSYYAAYGFLQRILSETYIALIGELPNEMKNGLNSDVIEAVTNFPGDVDSALRYLDNECMICMEKFPRSRITCLPTCGDNGCMYCAPCLEQHLVICITDKNIRDIVCPVCSQPEVNCGEDTSANFFNHIDNILRHMDDRRIHEIFQQKLRDYTLMRMPNFRWCSHCSGGFQYEIEREHNLKMVCPFCMKATCYKCKKYWEPQHEGISCEQFQIWKESNDPEFQAAGLARHLKENGIDCPDCNFRYALAKGGCMHFKCTQCSHEFCSGCNSPFKHGKACGKLPSCHTKGLHAHHPRDCLFYLRDLDPKMLQKLLRDNNVQYNTSGPDNERCQVMEQKETPTGLRDDTCGREVERNRAGLCKLHYNEYLVNLVNTNQLDPADVFSIDELKPCLIREDKLIPQKQQRETEDAYHKRLLAEVKKLSLIRRGNEKRKFLLHVGTE